MSENQLNYYKQKVLEYGEPYLDKIDLIIAGIEEYAVIHLIRADILRPYQGCYEVLINR